MNSPAKRKSLSPAVPLVFAIFILWGFGFETVGTRLRTKLEGTVISSHDSPATGAPRFVTEYILRAQDGRESTYVAGPTDGSLPRSMPIGTSIKKRRWRLDYERDGQRIDDFGISFYAMVLAIAVCCLIWSIVLLLKRKQPA